MSRTGTARDGSCTPRRGEPRVGGLSIGEGAWRLAPAIAIKSDLPFSKNELGDRIVMLRTEAAKDGVNLNTRSRASSGVGRAGACLP